jgi:Ca2+-binding RTX toxin-like protein
MENASSVRYNDATLTLAQAITLKAQANFGGTDGTGAYDLADAFATVQAADTALLTGAVSVRATSQAGNAETIDMSGLSRGVTVSANDLADIVFGSEFADTLDGGTGADDLTGGNGRDAFAIEGGDSGTGAGLFDQITDFTVATAGWVGTAANDTVAEFQALTVGGAQADILDLDAAVALTIVADGGGVTSGVLAGTNAAANLAAAVALANAATGALAGDAGFTVAFEHGGSTYVFVENGADDILVELSAVTGVNGLALLGLGAVGGAGFVIIG